MFMFTGGRIVRSRAGNSAEWSWFPHRLLVTVNADANPHLRLRTAFATLLSARASYNGNIEASQASDVGSIPIARSN